MSLVKDINGVEVVVGSTLFHYPGGRDSVRVRGVFEPGSGDTAYLWIWERKFHRYSTMEWAIDRGEATRWFGSHWIVKPEGESLVVLISQTDRKQAEARRVYDEGVVGTR